MREFFVKLSKMDRRWVFLGVALTTIIPFFFPLGLKVEETRFTELVFAEIEKVQPASDPDSKPVLISMDYDPGTLPEVGPMAKALLRHIFARKGKVIGLSFMPTGHALAQETLLEVASEFEDEGIREGIHWAYLPFNTPPATCIQAIGRDIREVYPKDFRNRPLDDLPIFKGVRNFQDIQIVIDLAGNQLPTTWIADGVERYGARFAMGVTNVMAADYTPTIPKQSKGMLTGMRGAAEYERMLVDKGYWKKLGEATRGMDSQSFTHLFIIVMIILGNLGYFLGRKGGA